jgi:hypothetical protein
MEEKFLCDGSSSMVPAGPEADLRCKVAGTRLLPARHWELAVALVCAVLAVVPARCWGAPLPEKAVTWKPIRDAFLTIDEKPVKLWNFYHAYKDKKEHRLLLQLGTRYLMFDTELRQIVEYAPAGFTAKGKNVEMSAGARPLKEVPSEGWILRDAGFTFIIHAKLKEEGRVVEIQVPKLPDLRGVLW